jgi:uncharacterized membrane protein
LKNILTQANVPPIIFAIASMILQSLSDCIYKRGQVKGIVPETFLVFQSYSFGLTALILVIFQDTFRFDLTAWKYGPVCGLLAFAAYYFFLRSLKTGQVSVNTMIFRMSFVLTAILGILFFHEPVSIHKIFGLLSATLAVLCLTILSTIFGNSQETVKTSDIPERGKQLAFPFLAFMCLGLLSFLYKVATLEQIQPSSLIFIQFSFFSPLAMIYAALYKRFNWHSTSVMHGLGAGVLLSLALILLVTALTRGEAGIMVPINQMSFALTAILAVKWFGEAWTKSKTIGVILATGAVFLLSSGVSP